MPISCTHAVTATPRIYAGVRSRRENNTVCHDYPNRGYTSVTASKRSMRHKNNSPEDRKVFYEALKRPIAVRVFQTLFRR